MAIAKDKTGSGDAFAAGMVSHLFKTKTFSFYDFVAAMEVGRTWAAYNCRIFGGSSSEEIFSDLNDFPKKILHKNRKPVEVKYTEYAEEILNLLDLAH